jgi:hypothetical protein
MAIAYNVVRRMPDTGKTIVDITLDGSYAAGGYALNSNQLGMLQKPDMIDPAVITAQGFDAAWDQPNHKLKMWKSGSSSAKAECVGADLSSAVVVRCECTGLVMV